MNVNQVAFVTTAALGIATAGSAIAAATTASTVAAVAYGLLAITLAGASGASVTAWLSVRSSEGRKGGETRDSVSEYFKTMQTHAGFGIAAMYQLVAQTLVQALVRGLAEGIGRGVARKIGGDDVTIGVKRT